MKKLLLLLFLAGFAKVNAQCALTCTVTAIPDSAGSLSYMFVGTWTGNMTHQYMTINPGPTIYGQDTVYYTFPAGGTYSINYSVSDTTTSNPTCWDNHYITITVGNTPNACGSFIANTSNGSGSYVFTATPNSPNGWVLSYLWDFGDGTTSTANPVVHNFSANGTYTVSVYTYAYDPNDTTQWCAGTTSTQHVVAGVPGTGCNASFTLFQDSLNPTVYYGYNNSTGSNLTYLWDFGDGNTSTQQYPSHTYNATGYYTVCLTVTDSTGGCTHTYCDTAGVFKLATGGISQLNILAVTTGLQQPGVQISANVFPNPLTENSSVSITSNRTMNVQMALVNTMGQTVATEQVNIVSGKNMLPLKTAALSQGIYFLSISENGKLLKNIKLVK